MPGIWHVDIESVRECCFYCCQNIPGDPPLFQVLVMCRPFRTELTSAAARLHGSFRIRLLSTFSTASVVDSGYESVQ